MIIRIEENGCKRFIDKVDEVFITNVDAMEYQLRKATGVPVTYCLNQQGWERIWVLTDAGEELYRDSNINYDRDDGKIYVHPDGELIDDTPPEE